MVYNILKAKIRIVVAIFISITALNIGNGQPKRSLEDAGLKIGGKLSPKLQVYNTDKKLVNLNQLLSGNYTVIVNGCLTCPVFLRTYPKVEAVYKDYKEKGVQFYYLYKLLAHPENNGYIQPFTIEERFEHIEEAKKWLATKVPWLSDPMTNEVSKAFGITSNSEFLFDPEGKIAYMSYWSDGDKLRTALQKLVGSTETKTDVSSLDLPEVIGKSSPVEGVVPRVIVEKHLLPIKVIPKIDSTPFYVKLRAEADDDLMETGSGKMYLGFHLDPLKHVHWNNLAAPVKYELKQLGVTTFTPAIGIGPQVEQPSDIDPREFFVDVKNWSTEKPIELTLKYFACDEDDKWCIPVTQFYDIRLERDPLAGRVYDRSMR